MPDEVMYSICPGCKSRNPVNVDWASVGSVPICCKKCGSVYSEKLWVETESSGVVFQPPTETTIDTGTTVFLCNKDHKLHLKKGKIVAKDHCNYRLEFKDGLKLWVPHHWVRLIPKYKDKKDG